MHKELSRFEEQLGISHWDFDFLSLARFWALRMSKDPSTKVGAVIVRPNHSIASMGYNGFPIGVKDHPERYADRDVKLRMVRHSEQNAMDFATENLSGYTLYTWPFMPCAACAGGVIQRGIRRCVAPPTPSAIEERWREDLKWSKIKLEEAGVRMDFLELPAEEAAAQQEDKTNMNIPCSSTAALPPCCACGKLPCCCIKSAGLLNGWPSEIIDERPCNAKCYPCRHKCCDSELRHSE